MALFSGLFRSKIIDAIARPALDFARRSLSLRKREKVSSITPTLPAGIASRFLLFTIESSRCNSFLIKKFEKNAFVCMKKKEASPFIIIRPERDDFDEMIDMMWETYFKEEPCMRFLQLGKCQSSVFDEYMCSILSQGLSLVAKCKFDGCIVGGCLNEGTCAWDPDLMDKFACTLCTVKMRQLFQFWAYIRRLPNLWEEACTPKIFEVSHMFVRHDDRGRGLGHDLLAQSIETGADAGYRLIRFNAPSAQTARIAEKQGMKLIYDIPYCTYIGANERPVINPPPPDTNMKVYVETPFMAKHKR